MSQTRDIDVLLCEKARRTAHRAAEHAGVVVLHPEDANAHHEMSSLFREVWGSGEGESQLHPSLIRVAAHMGNYVSAAYDQDQEMIGAAYGFFAADGHLHSHIAGVLGSQQSRGVGLALKLHQRAWALENGLDTISWTFDPLVRRNAYFNIHRLGVDTVAYLPEFYGEMSDEINAGDPTDRLFVRWVLASEGVDAAIERSVPQPDVSAIKSGDTTAVTVDIKDGKPVPGQIQPDTETVLVTVPADIESLRTSDPGLARDWRLTVRVGLGEALHKGYRVTGMNRDGWYVLKKHDD